MNVLPRVCIMIPTYNQANFIGKAVESALAQDYPNIEIVIADDCSTDNTAAILQSFLNDSKVKYKRNSTNIGRVANYRKCLYEYTTAEWVINLDGDDYYTNDQFISAAIAAIQKCGNKDILFYQGVNVLKKGVVAKLTEPNIIPNEVCIAARDYFFDFFKRDYFSHMSTLYHRPSAIKNDFYSKNVLSSDIFSILALCVKFSTRNVIVSKLVSGVWLQHENNISQTSQLKLHRNNGRFYLKLCRLALAKGFDKWECYRWLIKAWYIYLRSYIFKLARFWK